MGYLFEPGEVSKIVKEEMQDPLFKLYKRYRAVETYAKKKFTIGSQNQHWRDERWTSFGSQGKYKSDIERYYKDPEYRKQINKEHMLKPEVVFPEDSGESGESEKLPILSIVIGIVAIIALYFLIKKGKIRLR